MHDGLGCYGSRLDDKGFLLTFANWTRDTLVSTSDCDS